MGRDYQLGLEGGGGEGGGGEGVGLREGDWRSAGVRGERERRRGYQFERKEIEGKRREKEGEREGEG